MAHFSGDFGRLRQECDRARQQRQQFNQQTQAAVRHMADGVKQQLAGFASDMRHTHTAIEEMAGRLRAELAAFAGDLKSGGSMFRSSV
jgi:hypothetical protein